MKVLFLSPVDMTCEVPITSLAGHEVEIHRYSRASIPVDRDMLNRADQVRPKLICYIGSNDPALMAQTDTFLRLEKIAPTVMLCHDASDATWTPVLEEYKRCDAFSLVVAIDGNTAWPSRPQDYTALTPVPARHYRDLTAVGVRPVNFGFAGGYSSPSRRAIVEHLAESAGLVIPRRNEQYGSYGDYAHFLKRTKIVLNVPWSGSDNAAQVKGRVLEAGHAGCVLLEHAESAARHWFCAGGDYAIYESKEHAAEVVQRLLADPDEMERLAHALHTRVTHEHSATLFWQRVFRGVGLND